MEALMLNSEGFYESDWRLIAECDEYAVSRFGEIKRIKVDSYGRGLGRVLKNVVDGHGYPGVFLCSGKKIIRRKVANLVCVGFHGSKPTPKHVVAHNDGNKLSSDACNVRWATQKENIEDARKHGTLQMGEMVWKSKLKKKDVLEILSSSESNSFLATKFLVTANTISRIKKRQLWKHVDVS